MSMGQMVEDVQLSLNGRAEVHLLAKPGAGVATADELYKTLENILKKGAKEYAAAK